LRERPLKGYNATSLTSNKEGLPMAIRVNDTLSSFKAKTIHIGIKDKKLLFAPPSMPKAQLCVNPIGHTACRMSYRVEGST
jgi:hypothetical protein